MVRGKFITVEGIEGVGKSSNIDFIIQRLTDLGIKVVRTREPGGTEVAERIRQMLLEHSDEPISDTAELLLFFAARAQHVSNLIKPSLESGAWVVCDRFTDASRAYQGAARGQGRERVETLAHWVEDGTRPDLTLLLDAPAALGMERAGRRGASDRLESEQLAFYERARATYLQLAQAEPERFAVIDARRGLSAVQADIGAALAKLLEET